MKNKKYIRAGRIATGVFIMLGVSPGADAQAQDAIRPYHISVSDATLTDLRQRIKATRWPDKETVNDETQGVQLETMKKLANYWATDYDWRKCEAKLNALPQFITTIDGVDIYFIHVRSKHKNALPKALSSGTMPSGLSADEKNAYQQLDFFFKKGVGYANEMGLRPQTLYGIGDSPTGLAAWMLDHDARSYELIARVFNGQKEGLTRDDILDNITLYWITNTAIPSARLYWEATQVAKGGFFDPRNVTIPVAVSVFPDEIYAAPQSWTKQAYSKLIYFNKLSKGGHFAAWEQPQLFTEEMRAAFRSLR
ncbi:MAG: epoxide hydrolase [Bacteroidetes bacterium]|nr:epoxide hydrolase [Bacteroidota bacterium]